MLVSVIIPTLNEAENVLAAVAAARRDYAPGKAEIIVSDGGSTDDTLSQVKDQAQIISSPRGRAIQMNQGAAASHGKALLFCHADSRLPIGWHEAVVSALANPEVCGGTFQTLILPERGWLLWLRNRMRMPTRWHWMFGDQCQFMRREAFDHVNGFPEIPLMEDVEMSRALHRHGRLVRLPLRVVTSSRRFLERGPLRQVLLNSWCQIRYLLLGASPEEIAAIYRSSRERIV